VEDREEDKEERWNKPEMKRIYRGKKWPTQRQLFGHNSKWHDTCIRNESFSSVSIVTW